MKKFTKVGLVTALGLSAIIAMAQDAGGRRFGGGPGAPGGQRPQPAIIAALDANKDGKLDAAEIANATEKSPLKKCLDRALKGTAVPVRPAGRIVLVLHLND